MTDYSLPRLNLSIHQLLVAAAWMALAVPCSREQAGTAAAPASSLLANASHVPTMAFDLASALESKPDANAGFTPPVGYAQQFVEQGILIKAPASVDTGALSAAAVIVTQMLGNVRPDIRARLVATKAAIAITPKDRYVTALPEFAYQSGRKDATGREYDSFKIRGLGAVVGQPVTATAEENLLHLSSDTMKGMSVTHHEFAHAVMNLGFNKADRAAWAQIHQNGAAGKLFKDCGAEGDFAMHNPDEYWAVLSTAYFSRNWPALNTPAIIISHDLAAYEFLRSIYGPPPQ